MATRQLTTRLQRIHHRWLERRIPASMQHQLNRHNLFIFPSGFGWLFILLCIGLFLLGTNYQNNLMLLLCYFLLSFMLVSLFATYRNLSGLIVSSEGEVTVYAGDALHLPVTIDTKVQHASAHGEISLAFYRSEHKQGLDFDKPENKTKLQLTFHERGVHAMPRVTLKSVFPAGLFTCWTHLAFQEKCIVYPTPKVCRNLYRDASHSQSDENMANSRVAINKGGSDTFFGFTTHVAGMPMHRIAWKLFAKGRGLLDKQFVDHQDSELWLHFQDYFTGDAEEALQKLCYQVNQLNLGSVQFGLHLPNQRIQPASGNAHVKACLTALAEYPRVP
ncbi:hypothetical protein OE749_18305 [Aestuariibacter sp. AA17]|uniref:DUF58 domain-containing protein n=1 Tax=Fluctibacter corallii TaxID=2984329 RepID=A0ABT3ADK2_9ALTE|nr:hypothetical protein [Aestuariibacter sp. AA17]MCV2886652.1 hypothetical protein [Aestuariibacter sp. AA17]